VIVPPGPLRVLVATRPVDFRKGMDGLAGFVKEQLGTDPFSGVIYVFRAKRADRVKLLLWDGSGLVLVSKRLGEGQVPLAPRRGWCAAQPWPADSVAGRAGLDARARAPRPHTARRAVAGAT
jgi:transposase